MGIDWSSLKLSSLCGSIWVSVKLYWETDIVLNGFGSLPCIRFSDNKYFSYHLQDAKDDDVDLSIYKGKVLLIVNVASKW